MPPGNRSLPAPLTDSAREARAAFSCTLCGKSYSRHNEYEKHLVSYEHTHAERRKELSSLDQKLKNTRRAQPAKTREDVVMRTIEIKEDDKPKKKAGFKKSGFKSSFVPVNQAGEPLPKKPKSEDVADPARDEDVESDLEVDYAAYDIKNPTECGPMCACQLAS